MAKAPDDLNDRLTREFARREKKSKQLPARPKTEPIISDAERSASSSVPLTQAPLVAEVVVEREQMGLINRLRLMNAESAHQLERARLAYRTDMQLINHQSDAAIRESRAFWDAKSVEVAETIKTYVQATVRALELDRLDSRNVDIQRAYEAAASALEKARTSKLPEVLKDRLMKDVLDNFEKTLYRIQNDTIVSKYDLH